MKICKFCKKEEGYLKSKNISFYVHDSGKGIKKRTYVCSKCNNATCRKYRNSKKGKINIRKIIDKYEIKNKEKRSAWMKIYFSIRNNKIKRPNKCSKCGKKCKPDAHHPNYSYPLNVVWLCRKCHINVI